MISFEYNILCKCTLTKGKKVNFMTSNITLDEGIVSLYIGIRGFYNKNREDNFCQLELLCSKNNSGLSDLINFIDLKNRAFYKSSLLSFYL